MNIPPGVPGRVVAMSIARRRCELSAPGDTRDSMSLIGGTPRKNLLREYSTLRRRLPFNRAKAISAEFRSGEEMPLAGSWPLACGLLARAESDTHLHVRRLPQAGTEDLGLSRSDLSRDLGIKALALSCTVIGGAARPEWKR